MTDKDRNYYRHRISQESAAALAASCERARAIHCNLAELYAAKLLAADTGLAGAAVEPPARSSNLIIMEPLRRRAG